MPTPDIRKEILREKYGAVRRGLSAAYRRSASRRIAREVYKLPQWKKAMTVAIYMEHQSEADTRGILKQALSQKKKVAIPKVRGKNLNFFRIRGLKDCRIGAFGILEPKPGTPKVNPRKIDLILVPGLVFDKEGYRLGYGLGFYDRFLKKNPSIFSIGLTYQKTLTFKLPHDGRDVPVCCVVSEKSIIEEHGGI